MTEFNLRHHDFGMFGYDEQPVRLAPTIAVEDDPRTVTKMGRITIIEMCPRFRLIDQPLPFPTPPCWMVEKRGRRVAEPG